MSVNGRAQLRRRYQRRVAVVAGSVSLLALLFLADGHWVLGAFFGVVAAVAVVVLAQIRSVR
jgi:uncharacterized membrane protein YgaE (UPF0421/DUF939 family)